MRVLLLTCLSGLAACAGAGAGPPSRAQIASAIVVEQICVDTDGFTDCLLPQPRRAHLSRLRCIPASDPDHPERVLCRYAGRIEDMRGWRRPIGHDCAYFVPTPNGWWRLDSFPDYHMCGR